MLLSGGTASEDGVMSDDTPPPRTRAKESGRLRRIARFIL